MNDVKVDSNDIEEMYIKALPHNSSAALANAFSAICFLQKSRFTSSKPSISAIASDKKCIRHRTNSFVRYCLKYYTPLKRYCMKLVSYNSRYTVIAEDCVQEAFYRAVCHAEDFASSQNQYGWLAACCSHYMLSYIRKAKRREEIIGKPVSLEAYGDVPDLMDNVLAWIAHTECMETVEEFMAELSPLEQKVFRTYYEKGLSLKDTAQQAGLSVTSVRGTLDRIRVKGRHFHPMMLLFIGQCTLHLFKHYMK